MVNIDFKCIFLCLKWKISRYIACCFLKLPWSTVDQYFIRHISIAVYIKRRVYYRQNTIWYLILVWSLVGTVSLGTPGHWSPGTWPRSYTGYNLVLLWNRDILGYKQLKSWCVCRISGNMLEQPVLCLDNGKWNLVWFQQVVMCSIETFVIKPSVPVSLTCTLKIQIIVKNA